MARVLKITSGLMGVLLLVMVGVLRAGGIDNDPPQMMLIWERKPGYLSGNLVLVDSQSLHRRVIARDIMVGQELWAEDGWLYMVARQAAIPDLRNQGAIGYPSNDHLVRMRWSGNQLEAISDIILPWVSRTADGGWLVFNSWELGYPIYYLQRDGTNAVRLSPSNYQSYSYWYEESFGPKMVGSSVLMTVRSDQGTYHVHKADMTDGNSSLQLNPFGDNSRLAYVPSGEKWIVAHEPFGRLQVVWLDHPQSPQPLINENHEWVIGKVVNWLPESRLLIIRTEPTTTYATGSYNVPASYKLTAFRIGDEATPPEWVWSIPGADTHQISPDSQWLLITWATAEGDIGLGKMRPDSSDRSGLARMNTSYEVWGWSPDGQWAWYTQPGAAVGTETIWRARADGLVQDKIDRIQADARFDSWSPDGNYLIYTETDYQADQQITYRMEADGSNRTKILGDARFTQFVGWLPIQRPIWQPYVLMIVGSLLVLVYVLPAPLRRRFHPAEV